ncbi:Zrg8p [Saccharomyces eubayanus]|uniref:Zrg8p n=1 Tax=Saccharomyces eubayanus TaxID=1080349 RepID=UPI0006C71E60|nr:ZRG8-like protein [Saccharomyces eubayanus]KOG99980.1 ZRG8-like protein [Saccharomyces eubayanus]
MRSFIKSHKKSTSFDDSPKRHSNFSTNTNNSPQRSSNDSLEFLPSTPSQMNYDNIPTTAKHSPGFESFHRLANKTSKLFKKTSNSNLNSYLASNPAPNSNAPTSNSFIVQNPPSKQAAPPPPLPLPLLPASSTSSSSQYDNDVESAGLRNSSPTNGLNKATDSLPAIKGTITHSWGVSSKIEPHVIILNDPASPASNTSDATSTKQFRHSLLVNEASSSSSSNLEPAIRILNKCKTSDSGNNGEDNDEDEFDDEFPKKEKHIYKALALAKNRNRQARIHSHDDIINLGKTSQMDMSLLAAAFSGNSTNNDQSSNEQNDEKILDIERVATTSTLTSSENSSLINKSPEFYNQPLPISPKIRHGDLLSPHLDVNNNKHQIEMSHKKKVRINLDKKERKNIYFFRNNSDEYTNNENVTSEMYEIHDLNEESPGEEAGEEDDDDDDDDDDNESEFSFEYAGINVRTSSVKYYSKPEPTANVYIDDLYEDEIFDDDMNCIEDGESEMEENEMGHLSPGFEETALNNNKVKKYNDLFELTDDDDDDDDDDDTDDDDNDGGDDGGDDNDDDCDQEELGSRKESNGNEYGDYFVEGVADDKESFDELTILPRTEIVKKPIQKYSDLFDLSDEDEEEVAGSDLESKSFSDEAPSIDSDNTALHGKPTSTIYSQSNKNIMTPGITSKNNLGSKGTSSDRNEQMSPMNTPLESTISKPKVESFSDIFNIDDSESDSESEDRTMLNNPDDLISNNLKNESSLETALHENNLEPFSSNNQLLQLPQTPAKIFITPSNSAMYSQTSTTSDFGDDDDDTDSISRTPFQLIEPSFSNPLPYESPHYPLPFNTPPLPPPARSQSLKYHDLNCDLDSELPRPTSNLFFINEAEEDEYNQKNKIQDYDHYDIDEINGVPEDFNFSDSERDDPNRGTLKSPLRRGSRNKDVSPFSSLSSSFRSTHSFNGKLTINQGAKELAPMKNKIELTNKTVTFFNNNSNWNTYDNNSLSRKSSLQMRDNKYQMHTSHQNLELPNVLSQQPKNQTELDEKDNDNYVISPTLPKTVTPTNSFSKPTSEFLNDYSLSPIQETPSSVQSSPRKA